MNRTGYIGMGVVGGVLACSGFVGLLTFCTSPAVELDETIAAVVLIVGMALMWIAIIQLPDVRG